MIPKFQLITAELAANIRSRETKLQAWVDSIRSRSGWASYRPEDKPADVPDVTNDERSSLEVYEFVTNPPDKYFLYIKDPQPGQALPLVGVATTWTGEPLGYVRFGAPWRSNLGDTRVSVRISAINGKEYVGTYYRSSGDYARVRLAASSK